MVYPQVGGGAVRRSLRLLSSKGCPLKEVDSRPSLLFYLKNFGNHNLKDNPTFGP